MTQKSVEKTSVAEFLEDANVVYADLIAQKYLGQIDEVTISDIAKDINDNYSDNGFYVDSVINGEVTQLDFDETEITNLGIGDTRVIHITYNEEAQPVYYAVIRNGYYKMTLGSNEIILGERLEEKPEGVLSGTLEVVSEDESVVTVELSNQTVTIKGESIGGPVTIKATHGSAIATCNVTIKPKYTVTYTTTGAICITWERLTDVVLTGSTSEQVIEGGAIQNAPVATKDIAEDSDGKIYRYEFKYWAEYGITDATSSLNSLSKNITVHPVFERIIVPKYGATADAVSGDNALTVNGKLLDKGWRYLYEDNDNIYLIYADYYPAEAQTFERPLRNAGIRVWVGVSDGTRQDLLNYLSNTGNTATTIINGEEVEKGTWTSWDNLAEAFNTKFGVNDITAVGGTTSEMLINSYTFCYGWSGAIDPDKDESGLFVPHLSKIDDSGNESSSGTCNGWWLNEQGYYGNETSYVRYASFTTNWYNYFGGYNSSGAYFGWEINAVRPMVIIPKDSVSKADLGINSVID